MSKWSLRSHSNVSQPKLYSRRAFGLTSSLKGGVTSPTRHSYLSMLSLLLLTIPVMVNFCVVKDLCACTPGLTVHKFPRNAERRKTWVAKVPLKNFAATNSSSLCSSHFDENAYKIASEDTNASRRDNKENITMIRKTLKKDAIPTIWPNCPSYLSKSSTPLRVTKNSSGSRSNEDTGETSLMCDSLLEESAVPSLDNLRPHLDEKRFPESVTCIDKDNQVMFLSVVVSGSGRPEVRYSVILYEDLNYRIWVNEVELKSDQMPPEITFDKIDCCDQLYTILEYLDTNHGNISLKEESLIKVALETLELIDSSPKVEFIKEELYLMCCKPNGRRYSK